MSATVTPLFAVPDARAVACGDAFSAALLEALTRHLEKPVSIPDLEALCNVVGVRASEIARRAEEIQQGA